MVANATPRDAVLFSGYFPNQKSLLILRLFIDLWEEFFHDCDFFVGINRPSVPDAAALLEASRLKIESSLVEPHLVTDSDNSGYQTALDLLRKSGRGYRIVWFMHSKSASHCDDGLLNPTFSHLLRIVVRFLARRQMVTQAMRDDPRCGTYSFELGKDRPDASATTLNPNDVLGQFFPFERPDFRRYFCVGTMYAMKGLLLHRFIHECDRSFFTRNLVSESGADRYFFEQIFPNVAWRQGHHPRYNRWFGEPDFLETDDTLERDWAEYLASSPR